MKELFLYSFLTACFSLFLDYCMLPEEIFGKYRPWLHRTFTGKWKFLIKPLGGCVICFNSWLAILSFILVSVFCSLGWYFVFFYIGFNYVSLQVISYFEQ